MNLFQGSVCWDTSITHVGQGLQGSAHPARGAGSLPGDGERFQPVGTGSQQTTGPACAEAWLEGRMQGVRAGLEGPGS